MKKTTLIKRLGLGVASVAAIAPLAISATACSDTKAITVRYISYGTLLEEQSLHTADKGHFEKDQILLGSKKFFNGNYILFLGSNAFDKVNGQSSTTQQFFAGSNDSRKVDEWFGDLYDESVWNNEITKSAFIQTKIIKDGFGFVTFIDDFDFKFYDDNNHEIFITDDAHAGAAGIIQNIGPFDKWTDGRITQTRQLNKESYGYEWDKDEEITSSDYIRQDKQAKAYREFANRAAAMFPTSDKRSKSFDNTDNNKTGIMAVYKNGRLVDIADIPTTRTIEAKEDFKETSTLFGTINKYYTEEEEEK